MQTDDDAEIQRLLREAAGPRAMTAEERSRILERLEGRVEGRSETRGDLAASSPPRVWATSRRRRALAVSTVAAATVAGMVGLLGWRGVDDGRSSTVPADAATTICPAGWVRDRIEPLEDALDRWRTVENWAWTNGRPDLAELVGSALADASEFSDPAIAGPARLARERLSDALAQVSDAGIVDLSATAVARADAVDAALEALIEIGSDFDPACPFDRLAETDP